MSPEEGRDDEFERRTRRLRFRIAFFLTSLVALGVIVTLPFSVKSVVDDILGPVTGRVVKISRDRPDAAHRNHTKLHMAMVAIDETQLLATIRVSGHHVCAGCDWSDRVLFVSVTQDDLEADGMPPSVGVTLPASSAEVSEVIQLPVRGHPSTTRSTATASSWAWCCSGSAAMPRPRPFPPRRRGDDSFCPSRSCCRGSRWSAPSCWTGRASGPPTIRSSTWRPSSSTSGARATCASLP